MSECVCDRGQNRGVTVPPHGYMSFHGDSGYKVSE